MKRVIGIGNALVDIVLFLKNDDLLNTFSLPKGSMQLVDNEKSTQVEQSATMLEKHMASGGSAANTIHGLAGLGVETAFLGSVGNDEYGDFFKTDLIASHVEPHLAIEKDSTGRAISLVSQDGERTFATFLGAAVTLNADHIKNDLFSGFDHLHLEGYLVLNQHLVRTALETARNNNMTISLDLASYNIVETNIDFLKDIIAGYNPVVFANEDEARSFTGVADPYESLNIISSYCETAIVKTGQQGSLISSKGQIYRVGIIDVNCVDTTGAGDLYAAGFLYGLINGFSPQKCGEAGALLAGKVIEVPGAKIPAGAWEFIHQELGLK